MTRPPDLHLAAFLPYRLSVAANAVSDVIATSYKKLFGLTVAEWRLVAVLAEQTGLSQVELGHSTRMDKVTVSRAGLTLIERGLVQRTPHPNDKRSKILSLTPTGRRLYSRVSPKALALETELLNAFTAAEIESFLSQLRRIEVAADGLIASAESDPET